MFDFYGNERDRRPPSDEISLFVHQLLLRSSSSSAMACGGPQDQPPTEDAQDLTRKGNVMMGEVEPHASSSSEDMEFFVDDEVQPKAAGAASPPLRSSSKRRRAAEVHNMSEKRRRSRINEKMKALQNLIPNSNKTDKASMLDEAIEYLKQLQLQVQMLSMRNGISLHSMYLPRSMQSSQFSQLRFGFGEENQTQNLSFIGTFALNQDSPVQTTSTLRKPSTISSQLSVPDISDVLGSETSCNTKSSFQAHLGAFMLHKSLDACSPVPPRSNYKPRDGENPTILHACSSNEVCLEDVLPHENLYENHPENNPSEFGIGAMVVGSLPFEACASNPRDSSSQEVCETGQTNVLLENTKGDLFRISDFTMQTRSAPNSAMN